MSDFELSHVQIDWIRRCAKNHKLPVRYVEDLIRKQRGCCAWSGAKLFYDKPRGKAFRGGLGVHPLYASLDHCSPGSNLEGHQIVCYALNDLKGHIPFDCFRELQQSSPWVRIMDRWKQQAKVDPDDRISFKRIVRNT